MSKLRISPDLALPIDAVTQAIGILAKRRAGKSYTARRFVEQLLKAGQQVVIVDPKGDWWGIRSSADGKSPGLPVVILGGERGDVPLEVTSGEIVAKLAVEERVSMLLDLSLFRKHEVATFMTAFLEALYRLKAREMYRTPAMLVIDEADAIAPQKPQENEARMLGAAEDIVRRGGQRGLGCLLITQRSAVLNKNVLTQVEMLIALRTISPQDLKAMDAWIEVHGEKAERDTLMASLPALPTGDAWFWSPGWPTTAGIFQRVHVSPIETFDSGASPKAGEKRVEPKNLADVDLGALTKQMAATIEKAKANDPKELRKRIAELERALKAAPASGPLDERAVQREVAARLKVVQQRTDEQGRSVERFIKDMVRFSTEMFDTMGRFEAATVRFRDENSADSRAVVPVGNASSTTGANHPADSAVGRPSRASARPIATPRASSNGATPDVVGRTGAKILGALAFYESVGKTPVPATWVAAFVGMSASGGSWGARLSELRTAGYIVTGNGTVALTEKGLGTADTSGIPQSLNELHGMWLGKLGGKARQMLDELLTAHPKSMTKDTLAAAVDMEMSGGSFGARLSEIRSPGLLDDTAPRGEVRVSDILFPEGLK